jgi:hypothetical protein
MTRENIRQPSGRDFSPKPFEQAENEERFSRRQENGREDIARPMRRKVNS